MNKCLNCGKPVKNKYCNVSCQNKHQSSSRANKKYGEFKDFEVECSCCGKKFIVNEREKIIP
jgi:DNA-directed RNA polymerase subunit RPC12/RpoP